MFGVASSLSFSSRGYMYFQIFVVQRNAEELYLYDSYLSNIGKATMKKNPISNR